MPRNGNKSIVTAELLKEFYERLGSSKTHDSASSIPSSGSDNSLPTIDAVRQYVSSQLTVAEAMRFKGVVNASTPLPTNNVKVGDTYVVGAAGTYAGEKCEQHDLIIAVTGSGSSGGAQWTVVQANIDGAVTGPTGSTDNHIAVFDQNSGKVIKDSGFTIGASVPADAKFTDHTYLGGTGITLASDGKTFNHTNSITAGSVSEGGTARTLAFGGTFKVPSVSYDAQGHITATTTTTLTMPAQPTESSISVTDSGTGNGVASITATGHSITVTKGSFVASADKDKHSHGDITSGGTITAGAVTVASGDSIVITDSSASGKVVKSGISFDGTTTDKYLSPKGTWEYVPTIPEIPSITASTTGTGNAVTSVTANGHTVTVTKGKTFAENAFKTIAVKASSTASATNVEADSATDTLTLVAGSNVTLTPDATNDTITISATDTNTHYEGKNVASTSSTGKTNAAVTGTGGVYLNFVENDTVRSSNKIVGAGGAKVTSDANGVITISANTNTNTYVTGATVATDTENCNTVTLTRNDGNTVTFTPIFATYSSSTDTTSANDLNWIMGTYTGS